MIEQPFKIPFVAAVVMHANINKPAVAAEILKRTAEFCQQHMDQGKWREVKLMLRFLACLSGLFADDGIFPLLDELFNRAVDLQTASAEDVCVWSRGTCFFCLLFCFLGLFSSFPFFPLFSSFPSSPPFSSSPSSPPSPPFILRLCQHIEHPLTLHPTGPWT